MHACHPDTPPLVGFLFQRGDHFQHAFPPGFAGNCLTLYSLGPERKGQGRQAFGMGQNEGLGIDTLEDPGQSGRLKLVLQDFAPRLIEKKVVWIIGGEHIVNETA